MCELHVFYRKEQTRMMSQKRKDMICFAITPAYQFPFLLSLPLTQTPSQFNTSRPLWVRALLTSLLLLKEKLYAKIRRFQLRPPHTRHAVTCIPTIKDAKNYCLQNSLRDLVLLFPGCCKFGLPVPLFCFISWCSSKPFRLPPSSLSCPLPSSMPLLPTCRLHTHITYTLPTWNAIVRAEA